MPWRGRPEQSSWVLQFPLRPRRPSAPGAPFRVLRGPCSHQQQGPQPCLCSDSMVSSVASCSCDVNSTRRRRRLLPSCPLGFLVSCFLPPDSHHDIFGGVETALRRHRGVRRQSGALIAPSCRQHDALAHIALLRVRGACLRHVPGVVLSASRPPWGRTPRQHKPTWA